MQQIISRQEPVKRNLRNHTLYEWMIFEAENIVRHNWSDVAVHDQKLLNKMRPGDTRLWIISEFGSHFLPMYCKLYEKQKQEESEYTFSSVEVHLMRFVKDDRLGQMQSKLLRASSKFYFITKGYGLYDSVITPSDFRSVMDLVFCGNASHIIDNYLG
jgi:hypothetical protein